MRSDLFKWDSGKAVNSITSLTPMTTSERNAIANPTNGMIIFNTTTGCLNYFSLVWIEIPNNTLSVKEITLGVPTISMPTLGVIRNLTSKSVVAGVPTVEKPIEEKPPWWLSGGISAADCLIAYQPKGAADYATSKVNLANPGTYDAISSDDPGWSAANGWYQISGDYIDTVFNAWLPEYSLIIRYADFTTGVYLFGVAGTPNDLYYRFDGRASNGDGFKSVTHPASGVVAIADRDCYINGSLETSILQAWNGSETLHSLYLLGTYLNGGDYYHASCKIYAFALYKITLTGTQVGLLGTAMNAL